MTYFKILAGAALATISFATPSQATVISMAGDADCFGLGGTCAAGDLWRDDLGGVFFTDYSTAPDPNFTDEWDTYNLVTFSLAGGAGSAFTVDLFIAGIADGPTRGPYSVLFNGTQIGAIEESGIDPVNAFQQVVLFTFAVPDALVLANNVLSFDATSGGDGFIVDYASLNARIVRPAVPEPASWAMMIAGMGALGMMMRRRRVALNFA